jgi:hypothetical protein
MFGWFVWLVGSSVWLVCWLACLVAWIWGAKIVPEWSQNGPKVYENLSKIDPKTVSQEIK